MRVARGPERVCHLRHVLRKGQTFDQRHGRSDVAQAAVHANAYAVQCVSAIHRYNQTKNRRVLVYSSLVACFIDISKNNKNRRVLSSTQAKLFLPSSRFDPTAYP